MGWVRIGALGDLLVGLASLREALDFWPGAKFSVVGSKLWLEILEPGYWAQVDRIVVIGKRSEHATVYEISSDGERWQEVRRTSLREEFARGGADPREGFAESYDVVFNTRVDSPRQGFPALWARVPERWGTAPGLAKFIYNRRAPHDGKDPLIHERDVPLLLMDEAEAQQIGDRRFRGKTLEERVQESRRIRKWRQMGLPATRRLDGGSVRLKLRTERYFIVNPTSSRREKAWPAPRFRDLLHAIEQREMLAGRLPIVVGAPNETEWLNEVAGHKFRVVQPETVGELFDVVAGAEFLLTNTSSMQFIAASVGTRTLTLMGRARPEIWGPLGPSDHVIRGREPENIESLFEREFKAYESISVEAVLSELRDLAQG